MILVTGATGKVGANLVGQLRERGEDVRAGLRDPDAARLPAGVERARVDLADPATLDRALEGVDAVFLLWPLADIELTARLMPAVADAIAAHDAHVVYLSAEAVESLDDGFWHRVEAALERSSARWTFLRPTGFAANTLVWREQIAAGDVVRWPFAGAARSLIDERDIAAVAATVLTEPGHDGARPVITGPATVTQREQVETIGAAIGRPLRFEETTGDATTEVLRETFGDSPMLKGSLQVWGGFVDRPEKVTDAVERITGTPARPFTEWARAHSDDFADPRTNVG